MIKKLLFLKRIIRIMVICQILFLFIKNTGLVNQFFIPYEVIEAEVIDIEPVYNNVLNLKTTMLFVYNGKQEKVKLYHAFGDKYGKTIKIAIFDNEKIARLNFTFSYGDVICILFYLLLYFQVSRQFEKKRQQAATIYAKKLYKRQSEQNNFK